MDGFIFPERDSQGIDFKGPLPYALGMNRETKIGKTAKRKPKQSPKKAPVKAADDLREAVRESQNEAYNPWAYLAKYFDQI
jgi:hypothetical protein